MKLTIIGTGFVGVTSSVVYASFGHQVYGLDIDEQKVAALNQGQVPFYCKSHRSVYRCANRSCEVG